MPQGTTHLLPLPPSLGRETDWHRFFCGAAGAGIAPSKHLAGSARVSAGHLVIARDQHGMDLVGPTQPNLSWQSHVEGASSAADFAVD